MLFMCKRTSCGSVVKVAVTAKHGASVKCARCLKVVKYCRDCRQVYLNFREHRKPGHELYEFQRKVQQLERGSQGRFVSPRTEDDAVGALLRLRSA
jgi:uncharacterized metal-binding protein YceD (DUF177 family)